MASKQNTVLDVWMEDGLDVWMEDGLDVWMEDGWRMDWWRMHALVLCPVFDRPDYIITWELRHPGFVVAAADVQSISFPSW
jgi:hypothetical protein